MLASLVLARTAVRGVSAVALVALAAAPAHAEDTPWALRGTAGAGHAITEPQSTEFGFGGAIEATGEVLVARRVLGLEASIGTLVLLKGDDPSDPTLAPQSTGTGTWLTAGLRVHPFATKRPAGLWLDGQGGVIQTGSLTRPVVSARIGWDFRLGKSRAELGPFVGFQQTIQPDDALRPEDARLLLVGIQVGLGPADPPLPVRGDRDNDAVFDDEDACPDVVGIRTNDPRTNGCPRGDRDKDTIFDDEDACPDVVGIRTNDPKTNGCPRGDRDKDTIFDDEDACPDVFGFRTEDPKTNGCPKPDRDNDGVYDEEDACPDVPGVRTQDPKTNGCPPADEHVHVEGDRIVLDEVILFDNDSPRVRHVSWESVKKVADFINGNPDILEVLIEGHADAVGTPEHNLYISKERALAVKRMLEGYNVDPKRITTEAVGVSRPKVGTARSEQKNRRVEFIVIRARPKTGAVAPAPAAAPTGAP